MSSDKDLQRSQNSSAIPQHQHERFIMEVSGISATCSDLNCDLLDFPDEILGAIFGHLPRRCLVQISLTSRRFKSLALPYLYNHIRVSLRPRRIHNESSEVDRSLPVNMHVFYHLVSMFRDNDTLQNIVRSLSLTVSYHPWYERLQEQNDLIQLLPRLRSLYLNPPPLDLVLSHHPLLDNLHLDFKLAFYAWNAVSPDAYRELPDTPALEYLSRHLWYPSLRNLEAKNLSLSKIDGNTLLPTHRYRTSPITNLSLLQCSDVALGALPEFILSFKALQSFTLELEYPSETPWGTAHASTPPHEIGHSISIHRDTLVAMIVACSNGASFPRTSLFGTLAHFTCLRRLGILEPLLVDKGDSNFHSLLPPSLELLQLQYPVEFIPGLQCPGNPEMPQRLRRVKLLAEHKYLTLPSLKRVIWWDQPTALWPNATCLPASDMQSLADDFWSKGLKFEHLSSPFFEETPLGKRYECDSE